jgi:hypothetical protein
MTGRFERAIAAIDAANSADPTLVQGEKGPEPAALLYGRRMSAELVRLFPNAPETLRIAARGQHIERWTLPRESFPEGRAGYLDWRRTQAARHGERVAGIMEEAGYPPEDGARAASLLRKEGLKRDPEVQALEDVICFVFIRWYLGDFADGREPEELARIVAKTARKMSPEGRARALAEFDMPDALAAAFAD